MGRTANPGIKYFSTEVDIVNHPKIKLLFQEYDSHGVWIFKCLLCEIYGRRGYYMDTTDKDKMTLFASDVCKKPVPLVNEVIKGCVRRGLFDKPVFDAFEILTSDRIQETYVEATSERRRKGTLIELRSDILLIPVDETWQNVVLTGNNSILPRNNSIVPVIKTQSKEEESKVKKKKEEGSTDGTSLTGFLKIIFEKFKGEISIHFKIECQKITGEYESLVKDYDRKLNCIRYDKLLKEPDQKSKADELFAEFNLKKNAFDLRKEKILLDEIEKFKNWYKPRNWKLKGGYQITDESCADVFLSWLSRRGQFEKVK